MKIKAWAKEDRPREKFAKKGKQSLTNAELIAILIGSGNREESAVELSKGILNSVNNDLDQLGRLNVQNLVKFKGIGEAKAITIAAALELGRRRKTTKTSEKEVIDCSQKAFEVISDNLLDLEHEEFWIILLNRSNNVIDKINISKGGVSGTVADAKLIFRAAIEKLASSIILCHNHPSGRLQASKEDINLTKKLTEAGKHLDISIVDHLIVGNNNYFSFSDETIL